MVLPARILYDLYFINVPFHLRLIIYKAEDINILVMFIDQVKYYASKNMYDKKTAFNS